ncbi:MAG: hypothetical protein QOD42_1416 [Sphingomonadales bacterium]|nr:hypothetical protein [Sphingomonadales bacterium]
MLAIIHRAYGSADVLALEEVERPVPGDGEVLIRVRAASVNPLDAHFMRGKPYVARIAMGLTGPRRIRPGVDVAGEVESVGAGVTRFKPGDNVFGTCRGGAFADFVCTPESRLAAKGPGLSFAQAASLPVAGLTALQGLRDKGAVQPGQKVLINGAAGGIGTFAVQIAKAHGADVTGVCSAGNMDLVRAIGADRIIDYADADFTEGGQLYDLILDAVGNLWFSACRRVLTRNGILVAAGGGVGPDGPRLGRLAARLLAGLLQSRFTTRKLVVLMAKMDATDLAALAALVEAGKIAPVLDVRHGLGEVREAIRYVAGGHTRGKVVVTMDTDR